MHPETIEHGFVVGKRFRVLECFGVGEASEVYRAVDVGSGCYVTIKRFTPGSLELVQEGAFGPLARAAHQVLHAGIVPLLTATHSDLGPYYVRPYVAGDSLARLMMREGALSRELVAFLLTEALEAIAAAHRRGLCHLNLKPDNLLLVAEEGCVNVRVIDFLGPTLFEARVSGHPSALNFPHYMAPEQLLRKRDIGPAADLFSMGCLAYELLTGERPYGHGSAELVSERILEQIMSPGRVQTRVRDRELAEGIARALRASPWERYATADAFAAELRPFGFNKKEASAELLRLVPSLIPPSPDAPPRVPVGSGRPQPRFKSGQMPSTRRTRRRVSTPLPGEPQDRPREGMPISQIMARGAVLRALDAYVTRAFDQREHEDVLGTLLHRHPDTLAPGMLQGIVPYAMALTADYCDIVTHDLCGTNPMWGRRAGEDAVLHELSVFLRDALKPAPLAATLRRLALVFERFFQGTEWHVVAHSPHSCTLSATRLGDANPALKQWLLGITHAVINRAGGKAEVAVTSGDNGASREFAITASQC